MKTVYILYFYLVAQLTVSAQKPDCVLQAETGYILHLNWYDKEVDDHRNITFSCTTLSDLIVRTDSLDFFLNSFFKKSHYTDLAFTEPFLFSTCQASRNQIPRTRRKVREFRIGLTLKDNSVVSVSVEKFTFQFLSFRVYKEYIKNEVVGIWPIGVTDEFKIGKKIVRINDSLKLTNEEKAKVRSIFWVE